MRLHYHPTSPYSRKVSVAVELRGDAVERVLVDVTKGEHRSPAFRALSPFGKMPALETPDEGVIVESTSILEYLEEKGPRLLLPEGLARLARHWDRLGDFYILETQRVYLFDPGTDAAERALGHARTAFGLFERQLADGRPFLLGDRLTLADLAGAIGGDHFERMEVELPPRMRAWVARCFDIPAMREEREAGRPLMERFLEDRRRRVSRE